MFLGPLSLSSLVSDHHKMNKQPLSTMSSCHGVHHSAAQRHLGQLTVVKIAEPQAKITSCPFVFPKCYRVRPTSSPQPCEVCSAHSAEWRSGLLLSSLCLSQARRDYSITRLGFQIRLTLSLVSLTFDTPCSCRRLSRQLYINMIMWKCSYGKSRNQISDVVTAQTWPSVITPVL